MFKFSLAEEVASKISAPDIAPLNSWKKVKVLQGLQSLLNETGIRTYKQK